MSSTDGCAMNEAPRSTAAVHVPLGPSCNGCKHCWYAAPYGQSGDYPGRPTILSQPHSRCLALAAYVPMVLDARDEWRSSVLPAGCPEHSQAALFS